MNPIQIAYLKHFLYDKGIKGTFIHFYHKNRIKGSPSGDKTGNPESIEQFFLQTTVEDVIMKAFLFYTSNDGSTKYNFDYWSDVNDKWQEYWKSNENNFTNDKWPLLTGTFAILRQNWDIECFWQKRNLESTEEVYARMGIDMPLPPSYWEHGEGSLKRIDADKINYDIHNAKDGDIVVRIRKKKDQISRTILIIRDVIFYTPETSYLLPNNLHCDWEPGKSVYVAYLHAAYSFLSFEVRTSIGMEIHAVINDDDLETKYRLPFDGEIDLLTKELAKEGLAWNPDKKKLVPLSEAKEEESPLIDFDNEPEDDEFEEFEFFDMPKKNRTKVLSKDMVSINVKANSYRLTINSFLTKELGELGYVYIRIAKNKAGDICLIFNKRDGAKGVICKSNLLVLSSKVHILKLRELLGVKDEYDILHLKRNSVTANYISYIISK